MGWPGDLLSMADVRRNRPESPSFLELISVDAHSLESVFGAIRRSPHLLSSAHLPSAEVKAVVWA
jgi:hypothetical protein